MNEAPIARRRAYAETSRAAAPADAGVVDFRTAEQRAADRQLVGTWYRCRVHGHVALGDAIVVGTCTYCPDDVCDQRLLLVHSVMSDARPDGGVWERSDVRAEREIRELTKPAQKEPTRRAPAAEEDDVTVRDAVLQYLNRDGKARTRAEILAAVRAAGVTEDDAGAPSVYAKVSAFAARGLVERRGRGRYAIAAAGRVEAGGEMGPESSCAGTGEPEPAPPDHDEDGELRDEGLDDEDLDASAVRELEEQFADADDVVEEVETEDGLRVDITDAGELLLSVYVSREAYGAHGIDERVGDLVRAALAAR